jgi:hypothetical protein
MLSEIAAFTATRDIAQAILTFLVSVTNEDLIQNGGDMLTGGSQIGAVYVSGPPTVQQ